LFLEGIRSEEKNKLEFSRRRKKGAGDTFKGAETTKTVTVKVTKSVVLTARRSVVLDRDRSRQFQSDRRGEINDCLY